MYLIRRVWTVKRRETRKAATIAADIGKAYEEAGQRSATTVYFNGGTLPGEKDRVYMQWTAEVIDSPYGRDDNPSIPAARELGAKLRELTEGSWIEFYELMTPAKAQDYDT
ncbi:MAG: hypothetical protein V3U47_06565 [Acidimicrobiia bacterium]